MWDAGNHALRRKVVVATNAAYVAGVIGTTTIAVQNPSTDVEDTFTLYGKEGDPPRGRDGLGRAGGGTFWSQTPTRRYFCGNSGSHWCRRRLAVKGERSESSRKGPRLRGRFRSGHSGVPRRLTSQAADNSRRLMPSGERRSPDSSSPCDVTRRGL
jgi:hypothetical protein